MPSIMEYYREMTERMMAGVTSSESRTHSSRSPGCDWMGFLCKYLRLVELIPEEFVPDAAHFASLDADQRSVVATLLPLALRRFSETQDALGAILYARRRIGRLGSWVLAGYV